LPGVQDLTRHALPAAFRKTFGMTPSEARAVMQQRAKETGGLRSR
jgi:AraC-like DNA-binding protein